MEKTDYEDDHGAGNYGWANFIVKPNIVSFPGEERLLRKIRTVHRATGLFQTIFE